MVLARLPRLRSGADPATAFAGTFHVDEAAAQLDAAYAQAAAGRLPDVIPFEVYCHSLTDPSILGPVERATGHHTLTLFGLHTPAELYRDDPVGTRREAVRRVVAQLDAHLEEPLLDCLARDAHGDPCLQAASPAGRRGVAGHAGRPHLPRRPVLAGGRRRRPGGQLGRRDRPPADRRRLLGRARCAAAPSAGWAATRPPATCWTRADRPGPAGPGVRRRLQGRDLALIAAGLTFYAGIAVVPVLVLAFGLTARLTSPGPGGGARRAAGRTPAGPARRARTPSPGWSRPASADGRWRGCWPCCRCRSTARACDGRCCASADGARG